MWTITNEDPWGTIEDLRRQSDRGAALIAGALLENVLELAIKARFRQNPAMNANAYDTRLLELGHPSVEHTQARKAVEDRVFKGTGPLATFSAKIDIGLLLGLYFEDARKSLHRIRAVRNEFAHKTQPRSFNSQRIKGLCENFPAPSLLFGAYAKSVKSMLADANGPAAEAFAKVFLQMIAQERRKKDTPRNRYEGAIKMLSMSISMIARSRPDQELLTPQAGIGAAAGGRAGVMGPT